MAKEKSTPLRKQAELTARNFPSAQQEAEIKPPPSHYDGPESAYRLAFADTEFLLREELRPVRMQPELLKPEMIQREQGIESTIVIFGSARIMPPEEAQRRVALAEAEGDALIVKRARMQLAMSRYYVEAQKLAAMIAERSRA